MAAHLNPHLTPEEYLELDRKAEARSEYADGQMYAMAGATLSHVLLVGAFASELRANLKDRNCHVATNDLRVRVSLTRFTYPDIVVYRGEAKLLDRQQDTLLNPTLIVEVLSHSTRDYDLGGKFDAYRKLASLQEYVTVEQREMAVVTRTRRNDSWVLTDYTDPQQELMLSSLGVPVSLANMYREIVFS